jgi:hydrogenase/urease accessory protein HupE
MPRILATILLLTSAAVVADEIRPGYLEISESTTNTYTVVWKVPFKSGMKLKIDPALPGNCQPLTDISAYEATGSLIQRWSIRCPGGLTGQTISITGLSATITDVLVRLESLDGATQMVRLEPLNSSFEVKARSTPLEVSALYTWLGFEHILIGIDHLLFVLALLIIVNNTRRLLWTVTAFTISHSITLAGATLGWLSVPQKPVEAVIALSILFLATEIIHQRQGKIGLAATWPWLVAFIFGLLHGFGFAGALAEVGLPAHAIPLALLFFNVGVELGQIAFIGAVLIIAWIGGRLLPLPMRQVTGGLAFGIGGLAAFWTIERVASFWS